MPEELSPQIALTLPVGSVGPHQADVGGRLAFQVQQADRAPRIGEDHLLARELSQPSVGEVSEDPVRVEPSIVECPRDVTHPTARQRQSSAEYDLLSIEDHLLSVAHRAVFPDLVLDCPFASQDDVAGRDREAEQPIGKLRRFRCPVQAARPLVFSPELHAVVERHPDARVPREVVDVHLELALVEQVVLVEKGDDVP